MREQFLSESLLFLEKELGHGRGYSELQKQKIKVSIMNESDKALEEAFDRLILNTNTLPTPQQLIEAVRQSGAARREKQAQEEKAQYTYNLKPATEFAKKCKDIAMQFYPGVDFKGRPIKPDYKNILADAQAMAIQYPLTTWPAIYDEWQKKWGVVGKAAPVLKPP